MACDIDDREGESPSPMEPRLGRMSHSSATGRRREQTLSEAPALRQALHPRQARTRDLNRRSTQKARLRLAAVDRSYPTLLHEQVAGLQLFELRTGWVVVGRTVWVSSPSSMVIARSQDCREAFGDTKDHRADHASHATTARGARRPCYSSLNGI
jgi:hypothetical protein